MSRVQLALNVSDLGAAIDFYSKLFDAEPAKVRPGYANFAIAEPPLKLVLIEDASARGSGVAGALNHLGVEVASPDEVVQATRRLSAEGLATELEEETTCCYAVQDKVWVSDPDGAPWEVYTVLADAPGRPRPRVLPRKLLLRALGAAEPALRIQGWPMNGAALWRRLLAEALGSAFLAAVVVGSGIAAQQLSPGNVGLELFENAAATAAGLFTIILMFGPVSGGHFNPVVSFVDAAFGGLSWRDAAAYLAAQVSGCIGGAVLANLMFSKAAVSFSTKHRASGPHFLAEVVATLGLLLVIFALARTGRGGHAPAAVGAYIGAAYFFTSSTSFANPAITIGRMFSDTFAGIAPGSAPCYILAEIAGGVLGFLVIKVLYPDVTPEEAAAVVVPQLAGDGHAATNDGDRGVGENLAGDGRSERTLSRDHEL